MIDELLEIKNQIDASKPKDYVDIILSTRCPIKNNDGVMVKCEGKMYLILPWVIIEKIKLQCPLISYIAPSVYGIPVVENEKLVKDLLSHIHLEPDNDFELSEEAFEWVFRVSLGQILTLRR